MSFEQQNFMFLFYFFSFLNGYVEYYDVYVIHTNEMQ